MPEFVKYSCMDVDKIFPLPLRREIPSDEEEPPFTISQNGSIKLNKDIDFDELDPRDLKRIKILKKRRKLQNSLLYEQNLIQFEEGPHPKFKDKD